MDERDFIREDLLAAISPGQSMQTNLQKLWDILQSTPEDQFNMLDYETCPVGHYQRQNPMSPIAFCQPPHNPPSLQAICLEFQLWSEQAWDIFFPFPYYRLDDQGNRISHPVTLKEVLDKVWHYIRMNEEMTTCISPELRRAYLSVFGEDEIIVDDPTGNNNETEAEKEESREEGRSKDNWATDGGAIAKDDRHSDVSPEA